MCFFTRLIGFFLILGIWGCSSKPEPNPEDDPLTPNPAQEAAEKAIEKLDEEVGGSEEKEDFTGIVNEATGKVPEMETIAEPDAAEMAEYATGEPGWIEVSSTQVFPWSVPRPKAEESILQALRNEAVTKKVPTTVEVTSLLTDVLGESGGQAYEQTIWSGFFMSTVSGVITNQTELKNELRDLGADKGYELEMTYRFYVEPVQGQRDPGFYVDVQLENNLLKSGDELAFSVKPSKDCYLYVFNLMADQNIMLMMPNEYFKDNYIIGGTTMQIPDPVIRKFTRFRVAPMPGEDLTSEFVYIVCTKEEVPVIRDLPKIGTSMPVFSGDSQSFIKLQRWLTNIPLNQRVEKNLIYHISKN